VSADVLARYRDAIEGAYRARTSGSREMLDEAASYVAGGTTRATTYWRPYPLFVERGDGCHLYDVDRNRYVDWNGCFSAALFGNSPPFIAEAIHTAASKLLSAGAATESVHRWARLLCERYPSVERVRFCCSGSEAVMFGCRAARAYSGRPKILKQRGSYHGTTDAVEADMPTSQLGIPPHAGADMIYADFQDLGAIEKIFRENADALAGVLLNPVWFARDDGTLPEIVALARRHGVLVICDEVLSFRAAPGGGQEYFGFEADVAIFGKTIGGGGLAVGAFGGRAEIMRLFSSLDVDAPVHHSGTFAANPLTVAAGIAALEHVTPELLSRLNTLGDRLRAGFRTTFAAHGVRAGLKGMGSLVLLGLGELGLRHAVQDRPPVAEAKRLFGLALLNQGMFTPADAFLWAISEPMSTREIDRAVTALADTLTELRPLFERVAPELLETN
jgi:glutamate-1-semialdehyde 2,1-aminomutase